MNQVEAEDWELIGAKALDALWKIPDWGIRGSYRFVVCMKVM